MKGRAVVSSVVAQGGKMGGKKGKGGKNERENHGEKKKGAYTSQHLKGEGEKKKTGRLRGWEKPPPALYRGQRKETEFQLLFEGGKRRKEW